MAYAYRMSKRPGQRHHQRNNKKNTGSYIHPSKFVNKPTKQIVEEEYIPKYKFSEFGFSKNLVNNLDFIGYTTPTPIQDQAIPLLLEGHDLVGLANTGTGKTAAFMLPVLNRICNGQAYQMLVMAPTRELAQQIEQETRKFSKGLNLLTAVCVGGVNIERQKRVLAKDPHIIIGTPGRLKDLINQGVLILDMCDALVLDEADRMLDMGFLPDIKDILNELPKKRQSLFFSATITPQINKLIDEMLNNPQTVSVLKAHANEHIEQDVVVAGSIDEKITVLFELLNNNELEKVLIFNQTKRGAQKLADILNKTGIPSDAIHGNKTQRQREKALKNFKDANVRVLVATDVAARGIDVPLVSHVINFDKPNTYEDYVHRIGRTGRAGQQGKALTFINENERSAAIKN